MPHNTGLISQLSIHGLVLCEGSIVMGSVNFEFPGTFLCSTLTYEGSGLISSAEIIVRNFPRICPFLTFIGMSDSFNKSISLVFVGITRGSNQSAPSSLGSRAISLCWRRVTGYDYSFSMKYNIIRIYT